MSEAIRRRRRSLAESAGGGIATGRSKGALARKAAAGRTGHRRGRIAIQVALRALGIAWLASAVALADAPGTGTAPKQDEATLCDQVGDLCERARQREEEFRAAKRRVEGDARAENVDRYREAFLANEAAFLKLSTTAVRFWKKHGKIPDCFRQCRALGDVLNELKTAPRSDA